MNKTIFLYVAWIIAILGTLGSWFFGEGSGLKPCPLCWYQRVCLFPLVPILGVAVYKNFVPIWQYVIYQIFAGMFFAIYQLLQDYMPGKQMFCGKAKACISKDVIAHIPFPFLSFIAFLSIFVCLLCAIFFQKKKKT
ncbi:MAG: disulfide bond formation protein B [Chlamydiota bacterium]